MRSIYSTLLILAFLVSFAQEAPCDRTLSGKIVALDTEEPLPFATIQIVGTQQGAVADEQGFFSIEQICDEEVDLEIRFLGYKPLIHHHDFHHSNPTIYLAPQEGLLESVVVEAELNAHELKTLQPKSITIENSNSLGVNASDLLAQNAGVSTLKTGQNIVKPIIHGLHSNRVLVINNGVRHSYQAWGADHGVEIDASQIAQIQLIKGASTVRYGSDALGGVVLLESPTPTYNTSLNGTVSGGFQTNGRSLSGELSLNEGYNRATWMVGISGTKQGDLHAANYQLSNTGKEELGITASGRFHLPIMDINVFLSHFDQKLGILRGSVVGNLEELDTAMRRDVPYFTSDFDYEINNPRQETTHDLFKLESSLYLGSQQFDLQYAFQRNLRKEFDVRRGSNNERPAIDLELITHSLDLDWDHPSTGSFNGTLGLQAVSQDNNNNEGTNTIPFVPNYNIYSLGVFGIESYARDRITYEAGIRYDILNMNVRGRDSENDIYRDNLTFQNLTFTLGIQTQINDRISIRSNLGTAWRAPNINELYSFGKHQSVFEYGIWRYQLFPQQDSISTSSVLTNAAKKVKSERGIKWISTLDLNYPTFQLELTPYMNWIQNYFFTRPYGLTENVRGTFPYFIHDQTDALYAGIDLEARKQLNGNLGVKFQLSYVQARDTRNEQSFVGIPPLELQLTLAKQFGNIEVELNSTYQAQQTSTPPVIPPASFNDSTLELDRTGTFDFLSAPSSFMLINAAVSYRNKKLQLRIKGDNLLNSSYRRYTDTMRYFADDLGRNIGLFLEYNF